MKIVDKYTYLCINIINISKQNNFANMFEKANYFRLFWWPLIEKRIKLKWKLNFFHFCQRFSLWNGAISFNNWGIFNLCEIDFFLCLILIKLEHSVRFYGQHPHIFPKLCFYLSYFFFGKHFIHKLFNMFFACYFTGYHFTKLMS